MIDRRLQRIARRDWLRILRRRRVRADPHCWFCGCPVTFRTSSLDHLLPRSRGGTDHQRNLRLSCRTCNAQKADLPLQFLVCRSQRGAGLIPVSDLTPVHPHRKKPMKPNVTFNYDALADQAVARATREHARTIRGMLERTGEFTVKIGKRLIAVREALGPKAFQQWFSAEFGWVQSVAANYMNSARRFDGLDCLKQFQPYALYTLSRRNVPQAAIDQAIAQARDGEFITGRRAKDILAKFAVTPLRSDAGQPRNVEPAAKPSPVDSVDGLRTALDTFTVNLEALADGLSREDRETLADRFLQLAVQLRGLPAPQPLPSRANSTKRRRRQTAAA